MGKKGATPQLMVAKEGNAIVALPVTPHRLFVYRTTAKSVVS